MATTHPVRRSMIVGLAVLGFAFTFAGTASAGESAIPDDAVVVSSTVLGSGSFTMTATNVGILPIDLELAPPGVVSRVRVDFGSYEDRWMIDELASGTTATMTGDLSRPL